MKKSNSTILKAAVTGLLSVLLLTLSPARYAQAIPGDLDTSFDNDGRVITLFTQLNSSRDFVNAIALQTDRKIVAAGGSSQNFALARYNPDGSRDNSFSGDGTLTTDFNGGIDNIIDAAIQTNGRIVAAGNSQQSGSFDFGIARYNSDGTLDASFSSDGRVTTDFGGDTDNGFSVALQADGRIVVAGRSRVAGGDNDFALARYISNGSLDVTFGANGKVTTDFGNDTNDSIFEIAIQTDGKIVVAGESGDNFVLARYNPNGTLDTGFGSGGKVTVDFGNGEEGANDLKIQTDGKIVAAGFSGDDNNDFDFALARLNSNGSPDTTFSGDGKVVTDLLYGSHTKMWI